MAELEEPKALVSDRPRTSAVLHQMNMMTTSASPECRGGCALQDGAMLAVRLHPRMTHKAAALRFALGTMCVLMLAACGDKDEHKKETPTPPQVASTPRIPDNLSKKPPAPPPIKPASGEIQEFDAQGGSIEHAGARLRVPAGALAQKTKIELQQVGSESLPALPPGLLNVTEGGGGYRFLPEGQRFAKDVTFALPLRLPGKSSPREYWAALAPQAFFYDAPSARWSPLKGSRLSEDGKYLESRTTHFTLMINAIAKAPDHAGPANFNENAISSIGAGDPRENVDLIEPPEANNQGDAQVSFPIRLPAGRGAYTPQLTLRYSSADADGLLGVGWDLPLSSITVDTHKGVPSYDMADTYLLDGVPLIRVSDQTPDRCRTIGRDGPGIQLIQAFAERIYRFKRISLCKNDAQPYWEVVEPSGVRFYYGLDEAHRIASPDDPLRRVASWRLQEVEDPNGNLTRYGYQRHADGSQLYLASIDYTDHRSTDIAPAYRAAIDWDCARPDTRVSARYGFVVRTSCRLGAIDVKFRDELIRAYAMVYGPPSWDGRSLLREIQVKGANGDEFYSHKLSYSEPEFAGPAGPSSTLPCAMVGGFCQPSPWQVVDSDTARPPTGSSWRVNRANEKNYELTQGGGYSWGFTAGSVGASCSIGGSTGFALENPQPELRLLTLAGDGVAERAWQSGSSLRALDGPVGTWNSALDLLGPTTLESQSSFGVSQNFQGACNYGGAGANAATSISLRLATTDRGFADMDGDGLQDYVVDSSGDMFRRQIPRACRDGTQGSSAGAGVSTCGDGLPVCSSPASLCFTSPLSLSSASPQSIPATPQYSVREPTPPAQPTPTVRLQPESAVAPQRPLLPRGHVATLRRRVAGVSLSSLGQFTLPEVTCERRRVETNWGAYTSHDRRMALEAASAEQLGQPFPPHTIETVRPILRWDAPQTGTIRLNAAVRRLFCGGKDGAKVFLLKVTDFHDNEGTQRLSVSLVGPHEPSWVRLAQDVRIPMKFGESLLFVYDSLDDIPIGEDGSAIDAIDSQIQIQYDQVCPTGASCRNVSSAELAHRGATNEPKYLFRFPEDFRTSELPRQSYWQLAPPLGPDVEIPLDASAGSQDSAFNHIALEVNKKTLTDTRVHVRVRCESIASMHSLSDHVCPRGTVLDEIALPEHATTQDPLRHTVRVPEPFHRLDDAIRGRKGCQEVDPTSLTVARRADGTWQLGSNVGALSTFETRAVAEQAKSIASRYEQACELESGVGRVLAYPRSTEESESDCVDYVPEELIVVHVDDRHVVKYRDYRMMSFRSEDAATKARGLAYNYTRQCFVGRDNSSKERHRGLVMMYFSGANYRYDPYRLLVEVDGEDGWEVPPNAVTATAHLNVVSLREVIHRPTSSAADPNQLLGGISRITNFALRATEVLASAAEAGGNQQPAGGQPPGTGPPGAQPAGGQPPGTGPPGGQPVGGQPSGAGSAPWLSSIRGEIPVIRLSTLHRVHPARDLAAFETTGSETLIVEAKLVKPRHPLHLSLTAEGRDGPLWREVVSRADLPSNPPQQALTKRWIVQIPEPGTYYLRGYTEAWFEPETTDASTVRTSTALHAWLDVRSDQPDRKGPEEVAVNLVTADFGSTYFDDWKMPEVVGELPHSSDPYSGGHHGFFYGFKRGPGALTCLTPYGCEGPPPLQQAALDVGSGVRFASLSQARDVTDDRVFVASAFVPGGVQLNAAAGSHDDSGIPGCVGTREYCCVKHEPDGDCDGDAIRNVDDQCVLVPEDHDGNQDEDGCPESCDLDSDGDGIKDCSDECPFDEGPLTKQGCPDPPEPATQSFDPGWHVGSCFLGGTLGSGICPRGTHGGITPGGQGKNGGDDDGSSGGDPSSDPPDGYLKTWVLGLSQSQGFSFSPSGQGGLGVGVGLNASLGGHYTTSTLTDWNGDGIADRVTPNLIFLGGRPDARIEFSRDCYVELFDKCIVAPGVEETVTSSMATNQSASATGTLELKTSPDGTIKGHVTLNASVGLSQHFGRSEAALLRIDVNGDGLPDQLTVPENRSVLQVMYNLGRALAPSVVEMHFGDANGMPGPGDTCPDFRCNIVGGMANAVASTLGRGGMTSSESITRTRSEGGGGEVQIALWGGGGSYYHTETRTSTYGTREFVDVNGDGLVDIVARAPGKNVLAIAFNLGTKFGKAKEYAIPTWSPAVDGGRYNANLIESLTIPEKHDALTMSGSDTETWAGTATAVFWGIKGTTSFSMTEGYSSTEQVFRDVDGDGIPDRLLRTGKEEAGRVQYSRGLFGGGNLLKSIKRPFGGVISLEYARGVPSVDEPRVKWNLSTVALDQTADVHKALCNKPTEADCGIERAPPIVSTIQYTDGYYDRYEKLHYGYGTVRITRSADWRTIERKYYNRDYWLRGTLATETVLSDGKPLLQTETTYDTSPWHGFARSDQEYAFCLNQLILPQRYLDTEALRQAQRTPCDVRAPFLKKTKRLFIEGSGDPNAAVVFEQTVDGYDAYGNPAGVTEHTGGAEHPIAAATVDYDHRTALRDKHIVDRAKNIQVRTDSANGALLRRRQAQYDDRGNLKRHELWGDSSGSPSKTATLDIVPDVYGFTSTVTDANGYEISYVPEPVTRQFASATKDSFDLTASVVYDLRFQEASVTTDPNGNVIERRYDEFGRIQTVRSPYEREADVDTVLVEYGSPMGPAYPVRALTTNTAVDPDTKVATTALRIARFTDGLGREVQVQSETDVNGQHGRAISGRVSFDAAGRAVVVGEPTFALGADFSFDVAQWNTATCTTTGSVYCTRTTYDALDRTAAVTAPGDITTSNAYSVATHPRVAGRLVRQTETTDPEGKVRRLYSDAADQLVAVVELSDGRELKTTYDYSAAGDLLAIEDARGNTRTFGYDLAGRRTAIVTPDTGRMEMAYGPMGNLTEQTDEELCPTSGTLLSSPACVKKTIRRRYCRNRLVEIDYPNSPDVCFAYGGQEFLPAVCQVGSTSQDACQDSEVANPCFAGENTTGRVCWVGDEAGTEKRAFGSLGELRNHERTLSSFDDSTDTRSYATSYRHDSFGRLLWLEYPDGEKAKYGYDGGGRVKSVAGKRSSAETTYVQDRTYDVYGKPILTTFGNGVVEHNEYEPATQRLGRRATYRGTTLISSLAVTQYNKTSNIVSSRTQRNEGHPVSHLDRSYTYDDLHRLDTFAVSGQGLTEPAAFSLNGEYRYDDTGNIAAQKIAASGAAAASARDWTYAFAISGRPNLPNQIGARAFSYDGRGAVQTIDDGAQQTALAWNDAGWLATATLPGAIESSYRYDSDGARGWREVKRPGQAASIDELYHYPSPYYTATTERSRGASCSDDACASFASLRSKHIRLDGQTVASVLGIVGESPGGEAAVAYLAASVNYLHSDQVRSTVVVTDESGSASRVYEYLPFGELLEGASVADSLGDVSYVSFNGMERDREFGFDYFGARYYSPSISRWLNGDPLWLSPNPSNPGSVTTSGFVFAMNNPVRYFDPDGLAPADLADAWEQSRGAYRGWLASKLTPDTSFPEHVGLAVTTLSVELGAGLVDLARFGEGSAEGTPSGYVRDALRALGIAGLAWGTARAGLESPASAGSPRLLAPPGTANPWKGPILSTTAANDLVMYRVYGGESSQVGAWLTPVAPTGSAAARSSLALPAGNSASLVSEVTIPAGTRFQIGTAGPNFGQPGGGVQVQLLDRLPPTAFGAGKPLP